MNRDATGLLTASNVTLPDNLKLKIFRDSFRIRFREVLLAGRVIVVEGKTELIVYSAVAQRAAELDPANFQRLDAMGWVPFDGALSGKEKAARRRLVLGHSSCLFFDGVS
jgi:putative ATP-dependent endonuclease of OLD family